MSNLITLSNPCEGLDLGLRDAPGGFAWWYLDLIDGQGDGFVIIWSFGLPFLPGYLGAARSGRPEAAGQRPSLNVALYKGGRPYFYLLQEYDPEQTEWAPGRWRFDESIIEAQIEDDRRIVTLELDCPVPKSGERLQGTVRLDGAVPRFESPGFAPPGATHLWCPLAGPAVCQADLRLGDRDPWRTTGLAYHDRNGGTVPLDALGIHQWTWGRVLNEDALHIYYVVWPETPGAPPTAWGLTVERDGPARWHEDLDLSREDRARGRYGMPYAKTIILQKDGQPWMRSMSEALLDDGPFYLRNRIRVSVSDEPDQIGIGEWVDPSKVDRPWQRPFVRMRVHNPHGTSSFWLPLFSGLREGRVRRLMRRD